MRQNYSTIYATGWRRDQRSVEGNARVELSPHNVSALVAEYAWFVPMLAAAVIWTAHPQSIEATALTDPMVLASESKWDVSDAPGDVRGTHIQLSRREDFASEGKTGNVSKSTAVSCSVLITCKTHQSSYPS